MSLLEMTLAIEVLADSDFSTPSCYFLGRRPSNDWVKKMPCTYSNVIYTTTVFNECTKLPLWQTSLLSTRLASFVSWLICRFARFATTCRTALSIAPRARHGRLGMGPSTWSRSSSLKNGLPQAYPLSALRRSYMERNLPYPQEPARLGALRSAATSMSQTVWRWL